MSRYERASLPGGISTAGMKMAPVDLSGFANLKGLSGQGHFQSNVIQRLLSAVKAEGVLVDLRVGTHWTLAVVEREGKRCAGLASTQTVHDLEHGRPAVRSAGQLLGQGAAALLELALSDSLTERSIGFAVLNASVEVDEHRCRALNAEALILERGGGKNVAVVGHFPFVPRVREVARVCNVLELNPQGDDLPASEAPGVLPEADVVAITGMSLVNGTFEGLAALCRPDAFVILLGATVPLAPLLFDYGVDAIAGTVIDDIEQALVAVSQGANFRQIGGKRLLTMLKEPN